MVTFGGTIIHTKRDIENLMEVRQKQENRVRSSLCSCCIIQTLNEEDE